MNNPTISDASVQVTVLGAGTMGHGLALLAAKAGHPVLLVDTDSAALKKALHLMQVQLAWLHEEGEISHDAAMDALNRIETVDDISAISPTKACQLIVEAVTEDPSLKKDLYARLIPYLSPGTMIVSNTSYLNVFELAPKRMLHRFAVAHFFAPPYLVPLVEIVCNEETDADVVPRLVKIFEGMGQAPIVLKRFIPGFIVNRLQRAMGREIFHLLETEIADPQTIDTAVKASLALRMPVVGVVRKYDFTGLDATLKFLENPSVDLVGEDSIPACLEEKVKSGALGVKSGKGFFDYGDKPLEEILLERDRRILALRRFLKENDIS